MGRAQPVEQGVEGQRLRVHGRAPRRGPPTGLEEVAVVVPLHVVDGVLGQHGVHALEEVVGDLGPGQVQDLLVAVLQRLAAATAAEDPVGVLRDRGRSRG